jgi:hypothetical protein
MSGLHAVLVLGLGAGFLGAACGGARGGAPMASTSSAPSPAPSPGDGTPPVSRVTVTPAAAGSASATPAPAVATASPTPPTSLALAEMKAPAASGVGAELTALGLDPKNLPPIEKLEPRALRGVMKVVARSLGVRCTDCHVDGDFAAPTRRKKIAARMWNDFAGRLTLADGSALFCDSCHQGRIKLLDRSDKKALGKWMQAAFVDGLVRKDGQPGKCESCHVDCNMSFLTTWGR